MSSLRYPQGNGQAERTVQTVKRLLQRSEDPFLVLLSYHATPLLWCNLSPAELLMGWRLRTTVPQTDDQLIPKWPLIPKFKRQNWEFKQRHKGDFDRHHWVQQLPPILDNSDVWVSTKDGTIPGKVVSSAQTPRSYVVEMLTGELRRNRGQLRVVTAPEEPEQPSQSPEADSTNAIHSSDTELERKGRNSPRVWSWLGCSRELRWSHPTGWLEGRCGVID